MEAAKCVLNGGRSYLACVVDTTIAVPILSKVTVVNEYPDMFPDDLLGLPPKQEVELRIEWVLEQSRWQEPRTG
jgi:hypothetical protein